MTVAMPASSWSTFDVSSPVSRGTSITVRGLAKIFGATSVLQGLDLHAPAGQFLAIVGRSGCGKSTLLRLVAGLDRPDAGQISFGAWPAAEARQAVRLMFQEPRLLPWASVIANVEVGLGAVGGRARALEALASVGLADRAGEWPSILSGGQKQRVALARALVSRPRLLALDEPLGALDSMTRIEMQQLLEVVWQRERFTAILVTHDVAEAVMLADRILVLEGGRMPLISMSTCRDRGVGDCPMQPSSKSACYAIFETMMLMLGHIYYAGRPSIWRCRDHSAGKSVRRATPMP
jgi:sulfonate transport system ATP-binding protein